MATTYTRPSDWLTMPTVASSAQTFVGLFAVCNHDSNYVALKATTSIGNYQVDWGDGNITTHASNTTAEYNYSYSAISNTTLSSKGYKQVLITVTPVSGNILTFITNVTHSAVGTGAAKIVTWLEYLINLPLLSNAGLSISSTGTNVKPSWLEKVTISAIGTTSYTYFDNMFLNMTGLKQVNITANTYVSAAQTMFQGCWSLISVNLFNTSNITNSVRMFSDCYSLEQVPNFNLSKVTNGGSMFQNCYKLKTVPALDMRLNTTFGYMFYNCYNLTEIGLIDTRSGTDFSNFAYICNKLRTVANLNMSAATNANNAFAVCPSLDNFPAITLGNTNCNLTGFFNNTATLKKVGNMDVSKAVNFTSFFAGTPSLRTLPALNLNAGTTLVTMVSPVMASAPFTNVRASLSVANKNLGRLSIIEVFNGLASGVTSRTITISANPGIATLTAADRAIATAKGWTVAG
jgi:surface protein